MMLQKMENRFALWGIALTCLVGGVTGLVGYGQMTKAVRREATARVHEAARVGKRLLEEEFAHLDPDALLPDGAKVISIEPEEVLSGAPLYALVQKTLTEGRAEGFVLLEEGLCMVSGRVNAGEGNVLLAVWPLKGANWLPDHIRTVVFGSEEREPILATITIFEKDIRIATNVLLADGHRAIGTRVSDVVAQRVLGEGQPWNDRAFVVDRWVITSYLPINTIDGVVIGIFYTGLDEAPYIAQAKRSIMQSLAFILGLTLIMSVGGWYLGRRLAYPLSKLTGASDALGRGEREHIEVSMNDPEEVKLLADTFNRMADQIQAKTRTLESSNQQVQKALDDYMEVLGFVAHELKSPVAGALTQYSLIDGGYVGEVPAALGKPLAAIRRYLDYAHEIALSFNHLSRAESVGFIPKKVPIDDFCQDVVSPAIADVSSQASQREMTIALQCESSPLTADPDLMRVVLDNLIGNAVKYGQTGSVVSVSIHRIPQWIRVEINNKGIGVPNERFPELFRKFHRIHDPALKSRKGTGVGLYLVKKIVDLHGGRVGVDGQYGEWIEFWFEIPVHQ